jgi:hypothetical protein
LDAIQSAAATAKAETANGDSCVRVIVGFDVSHCIERTGDIDSLRSVFDVHAVNRLVAAIQKDALSEVRDRTIGDDNVRTTGADIPDSLSSPIPRDLVTPEVETDTPGRYGKARP